MIGSIASKFYIEILCLKKVSLIVSTLYVINSIFRSFIGIRSESTWTFGEAVC